MASLLTDFRVNEIYCEYLNECLNFGHTIQNDFVYQNMNTEFNKTLINTNNIKNNEKVEIKQIDGKFSNILQ